MRRFAKTTALAGLLGPLVFVAVFLVEGRLRPGYDPRGMFVSELSLGPRGWVQAANFLVSGTLIALFGWGLRAAFSHGVAARFGPLLVQIMGLSLLLSGFFPTDPSAIFDQHSSPGIAHGILGAVFFSLSPIACLVFARRFRTDAAWRGFAPWTLLAAALLLVGIVALKASQFPASALFAWKGLIQRGLLVVVMGWLCALAVGVYRHEARHR
jgi:hypothetical protein